MKTEYIIIPVKVKITYDKGYRKEAIEKANECVESVSIYGVNSSASAIGNNDKYLTK